MLEMKLMEGVDSLKEYLFKEIEIIQDSIKRMANNSFLIKGWNITLVLVTLLVTIDDTQVWIALFPLLFFWFLDAFYLQQERLFRELYKWVVQNRLKTKEHLFDMDTDRIKDKVQSYFKIMFSKTLNLFYGSLAILLIILYLLNVNQIEMGIK